MSTQTISSTPSSSRAFTALVVAALAITTARAQVSGSGDYSPNTLASPTWNVGDSLTVGDTTNASLVINSTGSVSNTSGTIANGSGSTSSVTVSGGTWTNSEYLYVGFSGNGTLAISGNGSVSNTYAIIGVNSGSNGNVTVSGGTWNTPAGLTVGDSGNGTLAISDNGSVFSNGASIGGFVTGNGSATVSGGSWTVSGFMNVGLAGNGTLSISGNGSVSAQLVTLGQNANRTGMVNLNGGILSTGQVKKANGAATATFNGGTLRLTLNQSILFYNFDPGGVILTGTGGTIDTQSFNVATAQGLTGNGSLTKKGNGTFTITGNSSYSGGTTVSTGKLLVNNSDGSGLGSGNVTVANSATLGGTGAFTGNVTVNGTLSPGASIETLASGSLSFSNNSTFAYEIDSSLSPGDRADLQIVTGDLELAALVTLAVDDLATTDTAFTYGTKFALLNYSGNWNGGLFTYGTAISDDAQFTVGLNTWTLNYNDTTGGENFTGEYVPGSFVTLTAVPEPATYALLALAGATLFILKRRTIANA